MNHREKRQALFVCFYVCVHIYYIIRRRYYMCVFWIVFVVYAVLYLFTLRDPDKRREPAGHRMAASLSRLRH